MTGTRPPNPVAAPTVSLVTDVLFSVGAALRAAIDRATALHWPTGGQEHFLLCCPAQAGRWLHWNTLQSQDKKNSRKRLFFFIPGNDQISMSSRRKITSDSRTLTFIRVYESPSLSTARTSKRGDL